MKRGDTTTKTVLGKKIALTFLGRGRFCFAYRHREFVLLFVKGQDYSKDALTDSWVTIRKHMPRLKRLETQEDGTRVYLTPYYPTLTAKDRLAWAHFQKLSRRRNDAWASSFDRNRWVVDGYTVNQKVIDGEPDPELKAALQEMADAASNYGASYVFEFRKGNMGVDKEGNLILRDALYDIEALTRK